MNRKSWGLCQEPACMAYALDKQLWTGNDAILVRKRRLFACACCRLPTVWQAMARNVWCVEAVGVAERYVDGMADEAGLENVRNRLIALFSDRLWNKFDVAVGCVRPDTMLSMTYPVWVADAWHADLGVAVEQAGLLRCLAGDPFRPPELGGWVVPRVARGLALVAWDERDSLSGMLDAVRLGVLADCLEESGCPDTEVYRHLRDRSMPHARGCWALDLCMGLGVAYAASEKEG